MTSNPTCQPEGEAAFMPQPAATRGQTLLGCLMALLLAGALVTSATLTIACAGLSSCDVGVAHGQAALPGYGLRG